MRSAYGFKTPQPDVSLTQVGAGTPGGELLRRYWHPVCASADLSDLPKRVRILGEDLVAFRDGAGRAGLLFFRCSHRGASLEYGRIEDRGLRCCYHGWLYDVNGRLIDTPLEPPNSRICERVEHPCYPVREFGGLVFAYMGPPEKTPEFPCFEVLSRPDSELHAYFGPRLGGAVDCNWLQSQENLMDPLHVYWLHMEHSKPQFASELYHMRPTSVTYSETRLGMAFTQTVPLPDGREWLLSWELMMPMTTAVIEVGKAPPVEGTTGTIIEYPRGVFFCVPIDDTHQMGASISWVPDDGEDDAAYRARAALGPLGRQDTSYEYTQRFPDDKEAMESQGQIANHHLENLASSDRGVILCRKYLEDAIRAVAEGGDPKGVIRDPDEARCVRTVASSLIRPTALPVA